jgi:phage tail sheath gpL-like
MNISNAVSESARSAVVGYKITKGNFALSTPNLPQRIAILSEANTDHQTGLDLTPFQANSVSDVAARLGAGSPGYLAMRILTPLQGGGLSGIPIWIYPVASASGATATVSSITIGSTAQLNATHIIRIAGRESLDGQSYSVNILKNDAPPAICAKYVAAINAVYGSPVIATIVTGNILTLTSKVKGTASVFKVYVNVNGNTAGVTYSIVTVAGTLTGDVATALGKFQGDWNTIVINPYNDATTLSLLESINGRPDPVNPTGRYSAITFKPFISFYSVQDSDPMSGEATDIATRLNDCTNVFCPAPNTFITPIEVAANVAVLVAQTAQNTPNLDVNDMAYPDAPVYGALGSFYDYNYRDSCVKAGISTVDMSGSDLIVKDLVTTYNPTDEITPQFKYVRNLMLDWNIRYGYRLLEQVNVINHTLVPDGTVVIAENTISPAQWKGILHSMFDDLADRGLIADASFSKDSLTVGISQSNPDRFETFFRYKRTGIARICSTTAEAGFYYGV